MANDLRSLPVGHVLSGYRIEGILGQGGFGITYLATDTKLMRQVAVKEYYPREYAIRDSTTTIRAAGNADDKETFEWGLSRFLKEAQLLARFEHPNIIAVRRFFEANGTAYLVMDYCDGKPLDDIIKRNGPLSEVQLEQILYPLLNGLEQVHSTGFLHRDIKPANLFIRADGSPVLLDFGSAIKGSNQQTRGVTTMVTDGYSPVEQYDSKGKQGPFTDIYGLAATLYRAVTGEKPQASTGRILNDNLEPVVKKARGLYAANLLQAIDAGMAVRPENRPQSIAEWRALLGKKPSPPKLTKSVVANRRDPVSDVAKSEDEFNRHVNKPPPNSVEITSTEAPTSSGKTLKAGRTYNVAVLLLAPIFFVVAYILLSSSTGNKPGVAEIKNNEPAPVPVDVSALGPGEIRDCEECPVMRLIPAGNFKMGLITEVGRGGDQQPLRNVSLESFYVSKYELTNGEWNLCVAAGACKNKQTQEKSLSNQMPVTNVTWYDAQAYLVWLTTKTGKPYQLLSESQWEYVARAGSSTSYFFGSDDLKLDAHAWYKSNAGSQAQIVGRKLPNAFGLYDMSGNVSEWTSDCWNEDYSGAPSDGTPWQSGTCSGRVLRGGAWDDVSANLRSAARSFGMIEFSSRTIGIRVARMLD
jgi:formylglycine-generating enzyme required for sulfatase activity